MECTWNNRFHPIKKTNLHLGGKIIMGIVQYIFTRQIELCSSTQAYTHQLLRCFLKFSSHLCLLINFVAEGGSETDVNNMVNVVWETPIISFISHQTQLF